MAHAVSDEPQVHMGLPMPHGKLAVWLFLVTEIMFFTGLIGTYVILRNGEPTPSYPWPRPEDVHLVEWIGALNTFVLICSSLTVVLAHFALCKGQVKRSLQYIGVTLALGLVFLGIKAVEYKAKFEHGILPGQIFEKLEGAKGGADLRGYQSEGFKYVRHVQEQIEHIEKDPDHGGLPADQAKRAEALKKIAVLKEKIEKDKLSPQGVSDEIRKVERDKDGHPLKNEHGHEVITGLLAEYHDLHLSYAIPFGNMWASCYFAMTGFHAVHVFGGLVIFAIILIMGALGRFGTQHHGMLEYTGLYWHFVDIVWIFLFPLLYLV